jgi:hypothetical protein
VSLLASWALAAALSGPPSPVTSRVEAIAVAPVAGRPGVRIHLSGRPGAVTVLRHPGVSRFVLSRTSLGWRFAGSRRFEWTPASGLGRLPVGAVAGLDGVLVEEAAGEVRIDVRAPANVLAEVRRVSTGLVIELRERPPAPLVAAAPPPPAPAPVEPPAAPPTPAPAIQSEPVVAPPAAPPAPAPVAVADAPEAPTVEPTIPASPTPPAAEGPASVPPIAIAEAPPLAVTDPPAAEPGRAVPPAEPPPTVSADLYRQLFPAAAADSPGPGDADVGQLYARLFPGGGAGRDEPLDAALAPDAAAAPDAPPEGIAIGPFRVRPTLTVSFVDADAPLLQSPETTSERYLQIDPALWARAPVRAGAFTLEYAPSFRGFSELETVVAPTHVLSADLAYPLGAASRLEIGDRFVHSTLDTREADPGGEYFFDLTPFSRNAVSARTRLAVAPRWDVELAGTYDTVRFDEDGGFFSHDRRTVSAGMGYELAPSFRAAVTYAYDQVPTPDERPEAEASAHSALVSLEGDLMPLLTGQLSFGYRDQRSPRAGTGGTRYRGLSMAGSLTREISREAALSLRVVRATPASSFEQNAFYVTTSIQAALSAPLPASLTLDAGLGATWNGYRTPSATTGTPREDRLLVFHLGVRRPIDERVFIGGFYRRETRRSNLDLFDVTSDAFLLEASFGLFGPRR